MSKPSLRSLAGDPRFIPGIYNYCDRWCERCPLPSRCLLFAQTKAGDEPKEVDDVVRSVGETFKEAMALIQEVADEEGIDLAQPLDAAEVVTERVVREAIDAHPLPKAAKQYTVMAYAWLDGNVNEPGDGAVGSKLSAGNLARDGAGPFMTAAEALTVIQWYVPQIGPKVFRAVSGLQYERASGEPDDVQSDSNGSARVALLGIERSLDAWFEIMPCCRVTAPIVRMLEHLSALRDDVERAFPNARRFVRPGFDTGDAPWPGDDNARTLGRTRP